jgi:hypothetical protein
MSDPASGCRGFGKGMVGELDCLLSIKLDQGMIAGSEQQRKP